MTLFELFGPPMCPNRIVETYYTQLGWLQIRELLEYHNIITLESIMKFGAPASLAVQLQTEFDRITRQRNNRAIRKTQETASIFGPLEKAFLVRACLLYNTLPAYNLPDRNLDEEEFKKALRAQILFKYRFIQRYR